MYRIIKRKGYYYIQEKHWYHPFWGDSNYYGNFFGNVKSAKEFIKRLRTKVTDEVVWEEKENAKR